MEKLGATKLAKAAEFVESGVEEMPNDYAMPSDHWRCLRTDNPLTG